MTDVVILVEKGVILGLVHHVQFSSLALAVVGHQRKHSPVTNFTKAVQQEKLRSCAIDLVQLSGHVVDMSVGALAVRWLR